MKIINKEDGQRIFRDSYFSKPPRTALLAGIKAVFICLLSASLSGIFVRLYSDADIVPLCAGISALFSAVIYFLASVLPPAAVYGGLGVMTAAGAYFFRKKLISYAQYFWDHMMFRLESRLLDTSTLYINDIHKIKNGYLAERTNEAFVYGAILLSLVIALVFAVSMRKKPKLLVPLVMGALVCAPAIAAETAGFSPLIVIYVTAAFGIAGISSSYDLDNKIVFGGILTARSSILHKENSYRIRAKSLRFFERFRSDISHYQKYTSNAIATTVIAAGVFTAAALIIPEGRGISYEEVFDAVTRAATTVVDTIGNLLGTNFGTVNDRGYFSCSSYGDVSGSISIEPPGEGDFPVIEVTLERNDIPVYLRGDIGVEFTGSAWKSVSDVYDEYSKEAGLSLTYYPEENYFFFRQCLASAGFMPDDIIPLQTVSVKYLRNTRVLFQPSSPYDLNYKKSAYYDWYGDFILRSKHGYIKTHESLALTPAITVPYFTADGYTASEIMEKAAYKPSSYFTEESYRYLELVDSAYGHNDSESEKLIEDFAREFAAEYGASRDPSDVSLDLIQNLCMYFRDNFEYSTDPKMNGKPENSLKSFLYETHKGHCALFASAMALTLRYLGIPARYVTGYVTAGDGEYRNGKYVYELTDKNLHAWTEVFFPMLGIWLPFDPTAAVPGYYETVNLAELDPYMPPEERAATTTEAVSPGEETDTTTGTDGEEEEEEDTEETDLAGDTTAPGDNDPSGDGEGPHGTSENILIVLLPFIAGAAVAIALIVIVILFVRSVNRAEKKAVKSFRKLPPDEAVLKMYGLMLKMLDREGIKPGNERMHEFAKRADAYLISHGVTLFMADIIGICERSEFADPKLSPVTEEERLKVYVFVSSVYGELVKSKNALKRFFIKISLFL